MKWDTALRAPGEPHVRALSLRRFPMPVPTLAQHISNIADRRDARHKGPNARKHWKICNCKQMGLKLVILEIAIPTFPTRTRHHDFPIPTFKTQ